MSDLIVSQDSSPKEKYLVDNLKMFGFLIDNLSKHAINVDSAKYVLFAIRDVAKLLENDVQKIRCNEMIETVVQYINDRIDALGEILGDEDFHNSEDGFELISNTLSTFSDLIFKTLGEIYDVEKRINKQSEDEDQDDYEDDYQDVPNEDE